MKKKNFFRTAALLAVASVGFAGCSEDDNAPASSSVTGPIKEAVTLPSGVTVDRVEVDEDWGKPDVAWKEGSLTVTLPETVTQGLETPYKNLPSGLSVSNRDVKGVSWFPRISAFNGDEQVGYFYYATAPDTDNDFDIDYSKDGTTKMEGVDVAFVYVDGDVTITGGYSENGNEYEYVGEGGDYEYDYEKDEYVPQEGGSYIIDYPTTESVTANGSFKKGWNIQSSSFIEEITVKGGKIVSGKVTITVSSSASGAKWYFYDYNASSNSPAKSAKASKLRKLSKLSK